MMKNQNLSLQFDEFFQQFPTGFRGWIFILTILKRGMSFFVRLNELVS